MLNMQLSKLMKAMCIVCFILFAVDFLGIGWYIFGVTSMFAVAYYIIAKKNIMIDAQFMWVIFLGVANFAIMFVHSDASIIIKTVKYLMSPIFGYLIGVTVASERKKGDSIVKVYMIAVIPYFIHGILNLLIFDGEIGWEREIPDFWNGELWKATLACTYFAIAAPLGFLALVSKRVWKKLAYLFFTVYAIYACIITASRSVIYITLIVILMEFVLYMLERKPVHRAPMHRSTNKKVKVLLQFLLVIGLVMFLLARNMDSLSSTEFFRRMTKLDASDEPRIHLFKNIIFNTIYYPFGDMPYPYSHNTWLDFLRESGWITFICFSIITVIAIRHIIMIYKDKFMSQEYRLAVVAMMTALLIDMFVEPILDGAAILFCLFFYFLGVNKVYVKEAQRRKKNG